MRTRIIAILALLATALGTHADDVVTVVTQNGQKSYDMNKLARIELGEDDLVRILTERPDITALLDVTIAEPLPSGHPFYALPNCFLTPHIAGSLGDEVHRLAEFMLDEYELYAAGKPCRYEVTERMLGTMA